MTRKTRKWGGLALSLVALALAMPAGAEIYTLCSKEDGSGNTYIYAVSTHGSSSSNSISIPMARLIIDDTSYSYSNSVAIKVPDIKTIPGLKCTGQPIQANKYYAVVIAPVSPGEHIIKGVADTSNLSAKFTTTFDNALQGVKMMFGSQQTDTPPAANAGVDQSVAEGVTVQLDGSASADPDNDVLTYSWVQLGLAEGEAPVPFVNANTATPTFTAPDVPLGGKTLTFLLTVTANGISATDEVNVAITNINHVPVAEAGDDQQVSEGTQVTLNGANSFDADGDALTYTWVQDGGPSVQLSNPNDISPTFVAPIIAGGDPGLTEELNFTLTVEDNNPADAAAPGYTMEHQRDSVRVTVTNTNNPPTADAGQDVTVNEHNQVTLNGTASSDPDGDPLTYSWVQTGGPNITLTNASTATPSVTAPYVSSGGADVGMMLTVSDPFGGKAMAPVTVHVQNENDPPLASAARPSVSAIWPPDHRLVPVSILGVSDPNDNARITVTRVTQDEPTNGLGDGDTAVDAVINPDGTVLLRAERSGKGDGRVYNIHFTAADDEGSDSGSVKVSVPKNTKSTAVDSGQQFDSTQ